MASGTDATLSAWVDCNEFPKYTIDTRCYISTSFILYGGNIHETKRFCYASDKSISFTSTLQWQNGVTSIINNDYLIPTYVYGLR